MPRIASIWPATDFSTKAKHLFLSGLIPLVATIGAAGSANGAERLNYTIAPEATQWAQYEADVRKTIIELQPFRSTQNLLLASGEEVQFITLNPSANSWILVTRGAAAYHFENVAPESQHVSLHPDDTGALLIVDGGERLRCDPWASGSLEAARESGQAFAPVCDGRLLLRNRSKGSRSSLEVATDFLRDNIWKGEEIVGFVREKFYEDAFIETGELGDANGLAAGHRGPVPARTDAATAIFPSGFGLEIGTEQAKGMDQGAWYPVAGLGGVFASALQPRAISHEVLHGPGKTNQLDSVEAKAVNYFVAFDLSQYQLGFELGTDHPRLDWSPRPPDYVRVRGLPGPDGIDGPAPLVSTGMISPVHAPATVGAFTAGFKRSHGAFRWGELSQTNKGTHYGFISHGVIFSKLQPELSTLYQTRDGVVGMKTWTDADEALLPDLDFARQNGVPLIEPDPATGVGVPGALVRNWGWGNWSGSADKQLRTLRAGACLQRAGDREFLIYGYFSTATPSAMARTFQAYGCSYAMLLDMNALEHTYLALYIRHQNVLSVQNMVTGMKELDKQDRNRNPIPRFMGFPDNRDFFYVYRREGAS